MDIIMNTLERAGYPLRDYQMSGVKWMRQHEANGNGGILADEPGLGKTIQALALAVPEESHPTLIVVPKSVVNQWRELAEIIFGKDLVYVFQGSMVEGTPESGERHIVAPSYACREPGFMHGPIRTDEGCIIIEFNWYDDAEGT